MTALPWLDLVRSKKPVRRLGDETTRIPDDYLGAAAYLAVVAYPDEWEKRDAFIEAVKAWSIKGYIHRGGDRKRIHNKYRPMPNRNIEGVFNQAFQRIKKRRLPAVTMAGVLLTRGNQNVRIKPNTVNELSLVMDGWIRDAFPVRSDAKKTIQPRAVRQRVWSESKPVIHLAMVLNTEIQRRRDAGTFIDPLGLILDPAWLPRAVEQSNLWLKYIAHPLKIRKAIRLII